MPGNAIRVRDISEFLNSIAPLSLAEQWDNVGLLLGDQAAGVRRIMTCLTLTIDVAREAVERDADLIVSHHPVLFKPVQRLTTHNAEGAVLLMLAAGGINVYSPHTAFDSALEGINQQLALSLGLREIEPLRPTACPEGDPESIGAGRHGRLAATVTLAEFIERTRSVLGIAHLQYVSQAERTLDRVGVACGSAAEFIPDAIRNGCDLLLTGEARFHACLEARHRGLALILAGHYATERPAVEALASTLATAFPGAEVWPSDRETDPVKWSVSP
jgi:dinuclear metal center YbgI/SA1388 family protein